MEDDKDGLYQAMAYIEAIDGRNMDKDDMEALATAAHYLIQEYVSGHKPHNFDEVIGCAEYVAYG